MSYWTLSACISIGFWWANAACAQNCRIAGQIVDSHRVAIASVVVTVTPAGSGSVHQVLSDPRGRFELPAMPPGEYRVEAMRPGFENISRNRVALVPGSSVTLDLQMQSANSTETIVVKAGQSADGSLLAYLCSLSPGAGCETLGSDDPLSALDFTLANLTLH